MLRAYMYTLVVSLLVIAPVVVYSQESHNEKVAADLLRVVDWNFVHLQTGDVSYNVLCVPTQHARRLLDQAQREYPPNPAKLAILQAHASTRKAFVRLRFCGAKYRYDYKEGSGVQQGVFAFDGERYWAFDSAQQQGSILSEPIEYADPRFPILAWDKQSRWSGKINQAIRERRLHRIGTLLHGTTRFLVVAFSDADGSQWVLHLDPSRNHLLRQIDQLYRGKLSSRYEVMESVKVGSDVWFPTQVRETFYDAKGAPLSRLFIQVNRIKIGASLPDDTFSPHFPVGTRVSDQINHRVYIVTSPVWTFRRTLLALATLALLFGFWWWRYRLPGKQAGM